MREPRALVVTNDGQRAHRPDDACARRPQLLKSRPLADEDGRLTGLSLECGDRADDSDLARGTAATAAGLRRSCDTSNAGEPHPNRWQLHGNDLARAVN